MRKVDPQLSHVPFVGEYFGPWLVRERDGRALQHAAENLNIQIHLQQVNIGAEASGAEQARRTENFLVSPEGVAVIELSGMLMKQESSLTASTSTVEARRRIRAAVRSKEVAAIVLLIDSPGGTASGTSDLAAEVRRAAGEKRVVAYIEDLCASAAYWVASQADEIVANQPDALAGSLGTYLVVTDSSEEAVQKGRKVHVIATGPFKGAGVPGAVVTEEYLAVLREEVFAINDAFKEGVRAGRNLQRNHVDEIFTGRVWSAQEAVKLGLVDRIESFDSLVARLARGSEKPARNRQLSENPEPTNSETDMAETQTAASNPTATITAQPATIKEIRAACKGADANFIVEMQEKGATVTECMTEWMERQNAELTQLREQQKTPAKSAKGIGTKSLAEESEDDAPSNSYDGDPTGAMKARRDEIMRERKCSAAAAMRILARHEPELLEAANADYNRRFAAVYHAR